MRGHHSLIGWAATILIAVAYVHVLLQLAAAVLAVAVAVRLLLVAKGTKIVIVLFQKPKLANKRK